MQSNFVGFSIEDTDGDLLQVEGDDRTELVTVTINCDELDDAFYAEIHPQDARSLAAFLLLAAGQAEGEGIGIP